MHPEKEFYQITIEGHLGLDWSGAFSEVHVQHTEDGNTILSGSLPDQTALHGVLMRIRDLGLSLVEVKRIADPNQPQSVEVGTTLTGRPPHRTGRAGLPHPAPTLGQTISR